MVDLRGFLDFLKQNEKYPDILRNALSVEHRNRNKKNWLGWQWFEVKGNPAMINKMIVNGFIEVSYSSASSKHYKLSDTKATRTALRELDELDAMKGPEAGQDFAEEIELPDGLFDVIVGYDKIKEVLLRVMASDKPIHVMFIGDPSTAKSLFLMELGRIPGARYALGGTTSKAGIVDYLLDFEPNIIIVDELDKMDSKDYSAMLSLMESGIVTRLKKGMRESTVINTKVFAACNRDTKLPPELKSRFMRFKLKKYSPEQFKEVVVAVLTNREGVSKGLSEYIAEKLSKRSTDPRDAVRFGRLCRTRSDVDGLAETLFQED